MGVAGYTLVHRVHRQGQRKGSAEHRAIEVLLKGPELSLTEYGQPGFMDKGGDLRREARIRWWNS